RGLQTVTAFGVLADMDNGYPFFFAEMTLLTAVRTAAQSALAARELARAGARVHALLGAGSQAEFQALAFRAVLGIDQLQVFDVDETAVEKVRRNLEPLGFSVQLAESVDEAVEGADVITTCTADKARAAGCRVAGGVPGLRLPGGAGDRSAAGLRRGRDRGGEGAAQPRAAGVLGAAGGIGRRGRRGRGRDHHLHGG